MSHRTKNVSWREVHVRLLDISTHIFFFAATVCECRHPMNGGVPKKSKDDDFCVLCLEEEWGLPALICCKKRIHMECLGRCLDDGRQCPHCRQSLLNLLMKRVNW